MTKDYTVHHVSISSLMWLKDPKKTRTFFVCLFLTIFLYMGSCAMPVPGTLRGQKLVLDPLELELQVIISYHVGTGNQTLVLCKSS